jgi:hypothetical protein
VEAGGADWEKRGGRRVGGGEEAAEGEVEEEEAEEVEEGDEELGGGLAGCGMGVSWGEGRGRTSMRAFLKSILTMM